MDVINVKTKNNSYPIFMDLSFEQLEKIFNEQINSNKILIITDCNVDKFYGEQIVKLLRNKDIEINKLILESGEKIKNLDTINYIYNKCLEVDLDRNSCIVALGGGVIGDIAGFVASSYMRGIQYIQIPTTLISQVDSSIGGKTGVNYEEYKNLIGHFYHPRFIYMNVLALNTLDDRQFLSGIFEIIKYAIIKDTDLFDFLNDNYNRILKRERESLLYIINKSCVIKSEIVAQDEEDKGIRNILNFGHTIGHAIESASNFNLLHGECVALGMIAATNLSLKFNMISNKEYNDIISLINKYKLFNISIMPNLERIIDSLKKDKKIVNNRLNFILPEKIGQVKIMKNVNETAIFDILLNIIYN